MSSIKVDPAAIRLLGNGFSGAGTRADSARSAWVNAAQRPTNADVIGDAAGASQYREIYDKAASGLADLATALSDFGTRLGKVATAYEVAETSATITNED